MLNLVTGAFVVIGACVALALHHHRQTRQLATDLPATERRFAIEQYARRSLTTTLIGVIGLCLLAIEASRTLWLDVAILWALTLLVLTIPVLAYLDFRASRIHFRAHDEGVRKATRGLIDELKKIESEAQHRREAREVSSTESAASLESVEDGQAKGESRDP